MDAASSRELGPTALAGLTIAGAFVVVCSGELLLWMLASAHMAGHLLACRAVGVPAALHLGWGPALHDRVASAGTGWRIGALPGFAAVPHAPAFAAAPLGRRLVVLAAGPIATVPAGLLLAWLALLAAGTQDAVLPGHPPSALSAPARATAALVHCLTSPVALFRGDLAPAPATAPTMSAVWVLLGLAWLRATLNLTLWNLLPLPWSDGLAAADELAHAVTGRRLPTRTLAGVGLAAVLALSGLLFAVDVLGA